MLGLVALLADLSGAHAFALVMLLGAIPAAFAFTLDCYGDVLHARCGLWRPLVAGAGLTLFVLSAALRSQAVVGGVPRVAVSAIILSLFLYGALAVDRLVVPTRATRRRAVRIDRQSTETERLAA